AELLRPARNRQIQTAEARAGQDIAREPVERSPCHRFLVASPYQGSADRRIRPRTARPPPLRFSPRRPGSPVISAAPARPRAETDRHPPRAAIRLRPATRADAAMRPRPGR